MQPLEALVPAEVEQGNAQVASNHFHQFLPDPGALDGKSHASSPLQAATAVPQGSPHLAP